MIYAPCRSDVLVDCVLVERSPRAISAERNGRAFTVKPNEVELIQRGGNLITLVMSFPLARAKGVAP